MRPASNYLRGNIHHSKPLRYQRMLELPSRWIFDVRDVVDALMDDVGFVQKSDLKF